jgi:hypothetical protein
MAAFQGWAAGPNFSGAVQNMAQAVQVEEQRKARQSKQLQEVFKGIGDARRRKEDQAIASATAKTAQENKVSDRAVNVFSALNTTASRLAGQKPTPNDYVSDPDLYEAAVNNWQAALGRNQAQMSQLVANNPALKDMLGAQAAPIEERAVTAPGTGDEKWRNAFGPVTSGSVNAQATSSQTTPSLNENLAGSTGGPGNSADPTRSDGNIFDRTGRYLGGVAADLTQNYDPNSSAEEEQGFFKKAAELGLDAKSLYNEYTKNKANMPEGGVIPMGLGSPDNNGSIFGMETTPADLSGGAQTDTRRDTPTSQGMKDAILSTVEQFDLGDLAGGVYDAINAGIDKVMPGGLSERIAAFGESNLEGKERSQEVITLKEIAKESAEGAVAGIVGGMPVVLGLKAINIIAPGKRQVVKQARIDYAAQLQRIKGALSRQKVNKKNAAEARVRKARYEKQLNALENPPLPRVAKVRGPQATPSSYPGSGRFNPLP